MMDKSEQNLNEKISEYLDGEMTQGERAEFEREMAGSAELEARLADYEDMQNLLAELPEPELPEGLHHQIMSTVRKEALPRTKMETGKKLTARSWQSYAKRVCASAASIVLAVFVIGGVAWVSDSSDSGTVSSISTQHSTMLRSAVVESYDLETGGTVADSDVEFFSGEESVAAEQETAGDVIYRGEASSVMNSIASEQQIPEDDTYVLSTSVTSMDIKEYYITVEVQDVEQAVAAIAELDGYDKYAYIDYGKYYASASIERAVNSETAEEILTAIGWLGEVTSQSHWQSSLLDDYNDVLAGYEAKQEEYQRLLEILELTSNYDEVTSVMGYLDNCVASMEDYQSTMRRIESEATTPIIHITLEQIGGLDYVASLGERVTAAYQGSVDGVVYALQTLVLIGAWLVAPLAVLAAIAGVVLLIRRKRRKGGARHE